MTKQPLFSAMTTDFDDYPLMRRYWSWLMK